LIHLLTPPQKIALADYQLMGLGLPIVANYQNFLLLKLGIFSEIPFLYWEELASSPPSLTTSRQIECADQAAAIWFAQTRPVLYRLLDVLIPKSRQGEVQQFIHETKVRKNLKQAYAHTQKTPSTMPYHNSTGLLDVWLMLKLFYHLTHDSMLVDTAWVCYLYQCSVCLNQ
jgi:hypothetical protein